MLCICTIPSLVGVVGGAIDSPASLLLLGLRRRLFQDLFSMANTHSDSPMAAYCLMEKLEKQHEGKK